MARTTDPEQRHPIGVVSARTGLPQDLIRAWERRYQAVTPERGATGRRLYSTQDIERLKLLKRAVAGGRRISDVARLAQDRLEALVAEDGEEAARQPVKPVGTDAGAYLEECIEALESLDRDRLERALGEASIAMSAPLMRRNIIVPLMHTIGERWREGTMRIVQEHMASALVRSFISGLKNGVNSNAPRLLVTTPAGHLHELGALLAAGTADEAGWRVLYLGPNLPAEEIAMGVRQFEARAVALSVIYSENDAALLEELRRLHDYVAPVPIIVGGHGSLGLHSEIEKTGARVVADLVSFQETLTALDR